jgi:DnaJ family protein C protein 19
MMKLLFLAALVCFGCRYATGKWPWDYLNPPSTRQQALFRAQQLLSVSASATRQEIAEAHRRMIAMVHPDRGGSSAQVHEVNAARDLLLAQLPYESDAQP